MSAVRVISVNSELGAGTRGSGLGFDAIRVAAWTKGSRYFKNHPPTIIPSNNDEVLDDIETAYAVKIHYIVEMYKRIAETVVDTLKAGNFPILISGDHSNAGGTIAGLRMAYPEEKLGVIWIDAHADIHSPYTTPSGNLHGMPLAASTGLDNKVCQINQPEENTIAAWEELKNIGGIQPKVGFKDLIFIAVRDLEKAERFILKQNKVKNYTVQKMRETGTSFVVEDALKRLEHCDRIYVSFDVDSMDANISRGTGTPVKSGLYESEAFQLMSAFAKHPKVCCMELTEINPTLDNKKNLMAEIALEILEKVTLEIENRL
ncbi:MAG: arginase [Chitinophagales bacterium]|nr:arginase [Chitinophagales bacterium]HAE14236.1 arginase [Bacteroidota bacterium]MCB9022698.1 arginase [Chitinophagales bacterium]HAE35503.1 arginase [Bacteroidota bacterium]HPE98725.1 arginase [Chitinophagales bacterium]